MRVIPTRQPVWHPDSQVSRLDNKFQQESSRKENVRAILVCFGIRYTLCSCNLFSKLVPSFAIVSAAMSKNPVMEESCWVNISALSVCKTGMSPCLRARFFIPS